MKTRNNLQKWISPGTALYSLFQDEDTEFHRKYLVNSYGIHVQEDIAGFRANVLGLLNTKLDEKRLVYAIQARRFLLAENDMADWIPFVERLAEKEIQSRFWKRYRDHSAHQVLCFLLGAFIYENSAPLRQRFAEELAGGEAQDSDKLRTGFYYQWSTAALLHDFGYYLDVEKGLNDDDGKARFAIVESFFESIDEYMRDYIFTVFSSGGRRTLSDEERSALTVLRDLLGLSEIGHIYRRREDFNLLGKIFGNPTIVRDCGDAWQVLDAFATARDERFKGVFENYMRILATQGAPFGKAPIPIWDHGIASGILFLKLSIFCWSYFENLGVTTKFKSRAGKIANEILERIKKWDYSEGAFWGSLVTSCFAMTLHNLRDLTGSADFTSACYTSQDQDFLRRVGREVLPVRITDGVVPYLLMVVDQLQDWDRYPIVRTGSIEVLQLLEAQDLKIRCQGGKIEFRFAFHCATRRDVIRQDLNALVADWDTLVSIY